MAKLAVCDFADLIGVSSIRTIYNSRQIVAEILTVTKRETTGSSSMRRLRAENMTPGVFYESGKESIPVSIPSKEIEKAVQLGSRDVELAGDLKTNATIKAIQWDALGSTVLHVDLMPKN